MGTMYATVSENTSLELKKCLRCPTGNETRMYSASRETTVQFLL